VLRASRYDTVLRVTRYVAIRPPVLTILLSLPYYHITTYWMTLGYTTLHSFLSTMVKLGTPLYILTTFEFKLSNVLDIPYNQQFHVSQPIPPSVKCYLIEAICHQILLGWDKYLCGFTSTIWEEELVRKAHRIGDSSTHSNWANRLIASIFQLTTLIWTDRNKTLHGYNRMEAQQLFWSCILEQVRHIYKYPPILDSRFQAISKVPLDQWLLCSTTNLQRWLSRLSHQQKAKEKIGEVSTPKENIGEVTTTRKEKIGEVTTPKEKIVEVTMTHQTMQVMTELADSLSHLNCCHHGTTAAKKHQCDLQNTRSSRKQPKN